MEQEKSHILEIAQAAYDHVDMLWQEEYFVLYDEHLNPLFKAYGDGASLPGATRQHYLSMMELVDRNSDMWLQDDWYSFCDEVFGFALAIAQQEGWEEELAERFPEAFVSQ